MKLANIIILTSLLIVSPFSTSNENLSNRTIETVKVNNIEVVKEEHKEVVESEVKEDVKQRSPQVSQVEQVSRSQDLHKENSRIFTATAYTHTGNRTYTGTYPKVGTIAVDPRVIPLGSRIWVEGYGYGVAEDTGGVIKGNIIDVFMDSRSECIKWGRKKVKVIVLD